MSLNATSSGDAYFACVRSLTQDKALVTCDQQRLPAQQATAVVTRALQAQKHVQHVFYLLSLASTTRTILQIAARSHPPDTHSASFTRRRFNADLL